MVQLDEHTYLENFSPIHKNVSATVVVVFNVVAVVFVAVVVVVVDFAAFFVVSSFAVFVFVFFVIVFAGVVVVVVFVFACDSISCYVSRSVHRSVHWLEGNAFLKISFYAFLSPTSI